MRDSSFIAVVIAVTMTTAMLTGAATSAEDPERSAINSQLDVNLLALKPRHEIELPKLDGPPSPLAGKLVTLKNGPEIAFPIFEAPLPANLRPVNALRAPEPEPEPVCVDGTLQMECPPRYRKRGSVQFYPR